MVENFTEFDHFHEA